MTCEQISEPAAMDQRERIRQRLMDQLHRHRTLLGAFALRGVGILAGLALTFMLGRFLGASATGTYALVTQTTTFLAAIGLLGLDLSVVRHFSRSSADRTPIAAGMLAKVLGSGMTVLVAIAVVIGFGGKLVWQGLFGDVVGTEVLLVVCLTLLVRGAAQLLGGILRSQHRMMMGMAVALVIMPLVSATAFGLGIATTVNQILWATALGGLLASVIGLAVSLLDISTGPDALRVPMRVIFASSLPLWGAGITLVFGEWYALAVVARTLSAADAGVFRVATQIAGTLMIITTTISSVYTPQISSAFHGSDRLAVARLGRTAIRFSLMLAVPLAMAIVGVTYFFLPMIGSEFTAAMPLVIVMVAGQVLIALFGPAGLVLSMSGHERMSLGISITGTAALLVFAPLAAIHAGILGVAICVSAILVGRNLTAYLFVRYRLGIRIWAGQVAS